MWRESSVEGAMVLAADPPLRDSAQAEAAMAALEKLIAASTAKKWILDAEGIAQINSETIATLIRIVRDLQAGGGKIALINANQFVLSVLQTLRMAKVLHLHDNLQQALAYVNGRGTSAPT